MATAIKKSLAAKQLARRAPNARLPMSMEFLIFGDEDGSYYWTIVAGDGATLARSDAFASYDDAERAAQHVRDGVASAPFEDRTVGAGLVDLVTRRDATTDASDAERWLDEGGRFSSEAVAKSPALRLIAPPERPAPSPKPDSRQIYTCPECGHVLRWSGLGRHRVYFELGDSRSEDPVMNRVCPMCGHGLPGKNPK